MLVLSTFVFPSVVLWQCWLGSRKCMWPVKPAAVNQSISQFTYWYGSPKAGLNNQHSHSHCRLPVRKIIMFWHNAAATVAVSSELWVDFMRSTQPIVLWVILCSVVELRNWNQFNIDVLIVLMQEAWYAFHPDKSYVAKFMKSLIVGRVEERAADSYSKKTVCISITVRCY